MTPHLTSGLLARRAFLKECAGGIGMTALWNLLALDGYAGDNPLAAKEPQFTPRAKNVIFLFMEGGPSQIDLFDPKPEMVRFDGQALPESIRKNLRFAFIKPPRCGPATGRSRNTANRGWSSPIGCRISRLAPTTCAWSAPCAATSSTIIRASYCCIAEARWSAGRPWAPGCSMGSAVLRRICPGL
jgi:hypothetical protein